MQAELLYNIIVNIFCSDKSGKFEIMSELASKERLFYYQLALIWQAVLTPLLQSGKIMIFYGNAW